MARISRASRGGFVDHVLNRGNGRSDVVHKDHDFAAFVNLMPEAHEKVLKACQTVLGMSTFCDSTTSLHAHKDKRKGARTQGRKEIQLTFFASLRLCVFALNNPEFRHDEFLCAQG
jgi:hypothetical protein